MLSAFIIAHNCSIPGLVLVDVSDVVTDLDPSLRLSGVDGAV